MLSPHSLAEEIYKISEVEFMAHTIRAAQTYVETNHLGRKPYSVRLEWVDEKDGTEVVYGSAGAVIWVNAYQKRDAMRLDIAHEVGHILMGLEANGEEDQARRKERCDTFALELCRRHHQFYCIEENIARCKFSEIDLDAL